LRVPFRTSAQVHPFFQIVCHRIHLGLKVALDLAAPSCTPRPVVTHERSNDALDPQPLLHLVLERVSGVVAACRFDLAAVVADKDLALLIRPRLLRATLYPQRTVTTLQPQEAKVAPVATP